MVDMMLLFWVRVPFIEAVIYLVQLTFSILLLPGRVWFCSRFGPSSLDEVVYTRLKLCKQNIRYYRVTLVTRNKF